MPEPPEPTITIPLVEEIECPHCGDHTVAVEGGKGVRLGADEYACLQCLADGGNCCSLAPLNRYA